MNKYKLQSAQYKLPYHYLPQIEAGGNFFRHQSLRWGFAYLCYLHHIAATIVREKPGELFDAGCGDGRLISLLSQQSECNFTGQDCDSRAILPMSKRRFRWSAALKFSNIFLTTVSNNLFLTLSAESGLVAS